MKRIVIVLISLIMLLPFFNINVSSEDEKNILVIHAYHLGYDWTYNQNEGIRESLLTEFPDANIYTEFLDWKRFPSEISMNRKYEELKEKYKLIDIDLLVTTDDKALEFAFDYRNEIFNNAPIAFGGIIESTVKEIIGNENRVTGVYEKIRAEDIFELLQVLQPKVNKIIFIHDLSESGIRTADVFYEAMDNLNITDKYVLSDWAGKTYDEIQEEIQKLDKNSAVMFFSYSSSIDGVSKSVNEFNIELTELSSVPIYSNYENLLGEGVLGGSFLSGELQGKQLGELGIRILRGEDPDRIPHVSEATVFTGVDALVLDKYNIDVNILDEDVVILNEQFSFYETYKSLVYLTLTIICGLLAFIIILLKQQRKIRLSNIEISEQKSDMLLLFKELQISDKELKVKNNELEKYQEYLQYEVHHDYLTRLPNRILLNQYVVEKLQTIEKSLSRVIILFVDLDNFKFVNNAYGHHFGDEVLIAIAKRLQKIKEELFVSRIGGDEFVIIMEYDIDKEEQVISQLVLLVNQAISESLKIKGETVLLKASIGYSIYPEDGNTFDQLIIEADTAMFHAKKIGKSTTIQYNKTMSNVFKNEYIMISSLKEAYENKEFYLMFQPIMSSDGKEVNYFEALVRWNSKIHGVVPPEVFIELAETSGLIIPIGYEIIDQALEFASKLSKLGKKGLLVSINISLVQFYENNFVDILLEKIESANLKPENVEIEITESVLIKAFTMVVEKFKYLKSKGISVSLDDFGTGYSSLSYLQELPIQKLKIDKVFVDDIVDSITNVPLINATITLANNFDLKVVFEGVEEEYQLEYLRKIDSHSIQGYYFSKPLLVDDAIAFLQKIHVSSIS